MLRHASSPAFRRSPAAVVAALWLAAALACVPTVARAQSDAPAVAPPAPAVVVAAAPEAGAYANSRDRVVARTFAERRADWRMGALVYQVIVDRFAPPADLEAKRHLYPAPKKLRGWDEVPTRGTFVEEAAVWSHEIDFWGGDLASLRTKLDYVAGLGVDVLYLNPIHQAYTNHKYDAQDYFAISPEYGTRDDVRALAADLRARGLRLMLDGVFNHMGRTSPHFREALADPASPWRGWYYIGPEYALGYRAWVNVPNLPEVNLENPAVRARLWGDPDSVIRGYLRDGVDGWRLDVAFDIGFRYLEELTLAAHTEKPGALVIGEVWNYPEQWMPSLDGAMNMFAREVVLRAARGQIGGAHAGRMLERMVEDAGIEPLLRSWVILDNHDTPRLAHSIPDAAQRRLAQVLQFAVPGSPCIYYGVELGMTGGDDPEQRGPMRWDLVTDANAELAWMRRLIGVRKANPALRYGDFLALDTREALGFVRRTERAAETIVVLANASDREVHEVVPIRDGKIMSYTKFEDLLGGPEAQVFSGLLDVKVPPKSALLLRPVVDPPGEYTPYKRTQ